MKLLFFLYCGTTALINVKFWFRQCCLVTFDYCNSAYTALSNPFCYNTLGLRRGGGIVKELIRPWLRGQERIRNEHEHRLCRLKGWWIWLPDPLLAIKQIRFVDPLLDTLVPPVEEGHLNFLSAHVPLVFRYFTLQAAFGAKEALPRTHDRDKLNDGT